MELVLQERRTNDCGPCCLAMLTGCARRIAFEAFDARLEDGSTSPDHMAVAFRNLGYRLSGRRGANQWLDRNFFVQLQSDALLRVGRAGDNFHWVVWNAEEARVYDPNPDVGIRARFPSDVEGYYLIERA